MRYQLRIQSVNSYVYVYMVYDWNRQTSFDNFNENLARTKATLFNSFKSYTI